MYTKNKWNRCFVKFMLVSALMLTVFYGCNRADINARRPNILLISIDTLRADHTGCYGYEQPTSPQIDRLSDQGVLFETMYTPSPWTLPAHMSLMTGLYPSRCGVKSRSDRLPYKIPTLAEILSNHGYVTAGIVNSLYLDEKFGFARGFDLYKRLPESNSPGGVAPAINFLAKKFFDQPITSPFFLFLHYYDVHSDYTPLPQFKKLFVDDTYNGIADGSTSQLLKFRKGVLDLDKKDIQHDLNLYDAEIRQLDGEIKKLFKYLRKKKLWHNTLIVLTSDHGEAFLDHGNVLHGRTHYQELIHVPFIIKGPGIPASMKVKGNFSLIDVMPTILSHIDIDPPVCNGIDMSFAWQNKSAEAAGRSIFEEADHNNIKNDIKRAVIFKHKKLHYDLLTKEFELYDLKQDPKEQLNLAEQDTATRNYLFGKLKEFQKIDVNGGSAQTFSDEEIDKLKSLGYIK